MIFVGVYACTSMCARASNAPERNWDQEKQREFRHESENDMYLVIHAHTRRRAQITPALAHRKSPTRTTVHDSLSEGTRAREKDKACEREREREREREKERKNEKEREREGERDKRMRERGRERE